MIRRPHRRPPLLRVLAAAVVVASCGTAGSNVAVPIAGVDHKSAPITPSTTEVVFTPTPSTVRTTAPASSTTSAPPPSTTTTTTLAPPVSGWDAFDLHLLETIVEAGSDAVSATVMVDGEVVHEVALGHRTQSTDEPVEVGDRYRIASISKVVAAITVLRLAEAGSIDLDAPVGDRLAALAGVSSPAALVETITPRNLLNHRSGIAQYENLMFRRQVESCPQAAATGLSRGLEREPGTTYRYSNLNFCLLGMLIEDVTGRPYVDVMRDEVLLPLGLDTMRVAGTFDAQDGDVEHRSDEGRNYMEVLGAAGAWIASPTDVATIIDSLDMSTPGWKPLSPDTVADMRTFPIDPPPPAPVDEGVDPASTTTTSPPPPPTRGYGLGLIVFGPDSFGHTGTLESTHAMTARQGDGITWAITVSGDHPSSTRDLAGIIAEALRLADTV